ncbi:cation diffusion facilitator family transporter [Agaribacterium sp. ZY112]|uniref:cation diffusion facilitator family transporter n=1 Tax=Agaribacterium sp. ZY112 TaxID=3233574 RepID=UPI0035268C05
MKQSDLEKKTIRLGVWLGCFFVALGLLFAFLTGSEAILLDALFSLIGVVLALVTMTVSRLVQRPADSKYPFGYWYYESFLNLAKSAIILVLSCVALTSACIALFNGGRSVEAGWALIYALIASVGCLLASFIFSRAAKKAQSTLLEVDAANWRIDAVLSGAIALAFTLVKCLEQSQWQSLIPYVDPALVVILVVLTLAIPVRILRSSWHSVIGRTPNSPRSRAVELCVNSIFESLPLKSKSLRMLNAGRAFYVQLYLLVEQDIGIVEQDGIRKELYEALLALGGDQSINISSDNLVLSVVFTQKTQWLERSVMPESHKP